MDYYQIENAVLTLVRSSLQEHLRIQTFWIGDPKDSTFGISISLTWDGYPICTDIVNFIPQE